MADRVLGILGGKDMPVPLLKKWAESADILLAADSGADHLLLAGHRPHWLIGDLDSVSESAKHPQLDLIQDDDQSYTDCDKLLRFSAEQGHEAITLACVEGDRFEHMLATLSSSVNARQQVRFALRRGIGWVLRPGRHTFDARPGQRVSLLPAGELTGLRLAGVRWGLTGASLRLGGQVSISNLASESCIEVEFEEGAGLLVMEMTQEEMPRW